MEFINFSGNNLAVHIPAQILWVEAFQSTRMTRVSEIVPHKESLLVDR